MTTPHDTPRTSRREFVKTSAAAAVGAGLLGTFAAPAGAYAASDDTIKVGLVGCGGRGSGAADQALSTAGKVELVAMADAFEDRLDSSLKSIKRRHADKVKVDDDHKFVGFDAYQKVIDSGVDLVILATPPGFRPIHFEAAVKAGKHVFMEKPVATDSPGVRKVLQTVEEAKKKNLKVGVGLQRHHQNTYRETVKRLHDGLIGDIIALRVYWNGGGVWDPRKTRQEVASEMEYQMRNWYYYTWLCGDHICEQHIHNLDVGCWVKGAHPVKAYGMGGREVRIAPKYGEIYDHFSVEYEFEDGTRMFSQCRHIPNCWNSVTEHAHGSKGTANISGSSIETTDADGNNSWRYRGPKNNPYQTEHDDLFAAIREDKPYNEGANGAHSTLVALMGRAATYSGKVVTWDECLNSQLSLMPKEFDFEADPPVLPNSDGSYPVPVPGVTKVL